MQTLRSTHRHQRARWLYYAVAGLVVLVAIAFAVSWLGGHPGALFGMTPTDVVLTASMYVPVVAKSPQQLIEATTPTKSWVTRGVLYDAQPITSGTTTKVTYFNAINADKTITNIRGNGGTLPANTWFEPLWICVDYLAVNVIGTGAITGKLDDIDRLVTSGRGMLTITIGNMSLPQIPISFCHASGGPVGSVAATLTAPANMQFGNNGAQDSGYCIANSFTIPPNTSFICTIEWTVAPTLVSTTPFLGLRFDGNWYLPIAG